MFDHRPINRRDMLAITAGATAGLMGSPARAQTTAYSPDSEPLQLKKMAAAKGLLFGSPFAPWTWTKSGHPDVWIDMPYGHLFKRQCSVATILYQWKYMEPVRGQQADFSYTDSQTKLWASQGLTLRGHSLAWYNSLPPWFASLQGRTSGIDSLNKRIATAIGPRAASIWSWDVVNEALNPPDGLPGGLRKSPFTQIIGLDWMHFAFKAAREAAPKAVLVYNDYGYEITKYADSDAKRAGMLGIIDDFQKNKIPIDAIGIQSHMFANRWQYFDVTSFQDFLAAIAKRGLMIFITEMDVVDLGLPGDTDTRDRVVADFYRKFWDATLASPAVKVIETWGLADPEAWQMQMGNDPQFHRPDGTAPRPMLFDASLKPKLAAFALAEALKNAPNREPVPVTRR
jgi:endo-1,4-beta-xylanase